MWNQELRGVVSYHVSTDYFGRLCPKRAQQAVGSNGKSSTGAQHLAMGYI